MRNEPPQQNITSEYAPHLLEIIIPVQSKKMRRMKKDWFKQTKPQLSKLPTSRASAKVKDVMNYFPWSMKAGAILLFNITILEIVSM